MTKRANFLKLPDGTLLDVMTLSDVDWGKAVLEGVKLLMEQNKLELTNPIDNKRKASYLNVTRKHIADLTSGKQSRSPATKE